MTRSLAGNALWNVAGLVWSILLSFGSIPIFVACLGVREYGIFSVALASISSLTVLQFGLGEATTKFLAEYHERGDARGMMDVAGATLILYALIGAVLSAVLWALADIMAVHLVGLQGAEAEEAADVFRYSALGFIPFIAINAAQGLFNGRQRFDRSSQFTILKRSLETLVGVAVVLLGYGLVPLTIVNIALIWLLLALGLVWGFAGMERRHFSLARSLRTLPRVVSFGLLTTLRSIGQMPFGMLDRLVVAAALGPEAVSYYTVPANVAQRFFAFVSAEPTRVLMPFFSARTAAPQAREDLRLTYFTSWRVSILIALFLGAPCLAASPWFLSVWMGEAFAAQALGPLWALFIAHLLLAGLAVTHQLAMGLGRLGALTIWTLLAGAGTMAALWFGAQLGGIVGASAALAAYPLLLLPFAFVATRYVGGSGRDILPGLTRWLLIGVVATAAGLAVGSLVQNVHALVAMLTAPAVTITLLFAAWRLARRFPKDPYTDTLDWLAARFIPRLGKFLPAARRPQDKAD